MFGVFGFLPASDDEFARAEQERDDLRFVEAIDETGELFGFVLDVLETQPDRDRVQVEVAPEVGRGDDVLDDDLGSSLT